MSEGKERPKIQHIEMGTAHKLNKHIDKLSEAEGAFRGLKRKMQSLLEVYRLDISENPQYKKTIESIEAILAQLTEEEKQLDQIINSVERRIEEIQDSCKQPPKEEEEKE